MSEDLKENIVVATRPTSIDEIIGLEHNIEKIKYEIRGSRKLNEPVSSFIIGGPPGTGKTTLAQIIASECDGELHTRLGANITCPDDIYQIAGEVSDNDVVYIEEAHTIGGGSSKAKFCQAILLEWIEHHKLIGGADGVSKAPKVSFVLPTTNPGKLTHALRTRCKMLHTSYYSVEHMRVILDKAGERIGLSLGTDPDALHLLAQCSRGTPRIGIMHRLDGLRKMMAVDESTYSLEVVKRYLDINKINKWGLEYNDLKYCNILYDKLEEGRGRPVSQKIMQQTTGFSADLLGDIIEAYLIQIGIIKIESRGRNFTTFGYSVLGKDPISLSPYERIMVNQIDHAELDRLLSDEAVRRGGMKGLSARLGMKYPQDIPILRGILLNKGYEAKQRIGIVPVR